MQYPHLASRVFNTPLLIARAKLETILAVLTPKFSGMAVKPASAAAPPKTRTELSAKGVAVIPVMGTLVRRTAFMGAESGLTSYAQIEMALDDALADPKIGSIVLDIDSPGGEAGGVFDLADKIFAARSKKRIWAVANEEAFSAAYAIAAAAEKIYIPRTGGVGSIGVIAMHLDQSALDAEMGLKYTPIFAGARKNDLSPHEPITDPARAVVQTEVDRLYGMFVDGVARGRGMSAESIRATEAGVFFGQAAIAAGLADQLGNLNDALSDLFNPVVQSTRAATPIAKEMSMTQTSPVISDDAAKPVEATGETSPSPTVPNYQPDAEEAVKESVTPAQAEQNRIMGILDAGKKLRAPDDLVRKLIASSLPMAEAGAELINWKAAEEAKMEIRAAHGQEIGYATTHNGSVEEKAVAEYKASQSLQDEFRSEKAYVAFRKAEASGQVKILNRK